MMALECMAPIQMGRLSFDGGMGGGDGREVISIAEVALPPAAWDGPARYPDDPPLVRAMVDATGELPGLIPVNWISLSGISGAVPVETICVGGGDLSVEDEALALATPIGGGTEEPSSSSSAVRSIACSIGREGSSTAVV